MFNRLSYDHQLEIARLLLDNELNFLRQKGHEIQPENSVLPFIVQRGFHPKLGARPMRDSIEKLVGDAVANDVLTGGDGRGQLIVDDSGGFLCLERRTSESSIQQ